MNYRISSATDNTVNFSDKLMQNDIDNLTVSSAPAQVDGENMIPLDKTLVILYVFALLDEYDRANDKGEQPEVDPYREKILIKTDNGKYAVVPEEIQQHSINEWVSTKGIKNGKPKYSNGGEHDNSDDDSYENDKDNTLIDTAFQLIFCLLIIFIVLYSLSLFRKGLVRYHY
jgi:hypothetical protein